MKAIAAMSQNFVIGDRGNLPWHISEDFKFFKRTTLDQSLVMGRNTFETLPLLKRRKIFVLSSKKPINPLYGEEDFTHIRSILDAPDDAIIAGGAILYASTLQLESCTDLFLTVVHKDYEGDTFFPEFAHLFNHKTPILSDFDAEEGAEFTIWHLSKQHE